MKLKAASLLLVLFSFVCVNIAYSKEESLAERYYAESGMDQMLAALSESVAARLNLKRLKESKLSINARARDLIPSALVQVNARSLALDYLGNDVNVEQLGSSYAFLTSALGKKITRLEAEASKPEAQVALQAYQLEIASNPPPLERDQLIRALVKEAHMVDSVMQLLERLYLMPGDIARQTAGGEQAMSFERQLKTEWQDLKPALKMQFEQLVILSAHFSYKDLNLEELQQYIAFLSEPRGTFYWQTSMRVVDRFLDRFLAQYIELLKLSPQEVSSAN